MPYINFTEEQKQRAASTDLEAFLLGRGEKLLPSGREKRLASDHSITIHGSNWYDHSAQVGGNAIGFVRRCYGLSYPEAVTMLLDSGAEPWAGPPEEEPKPFLPPPANETMRRVFAYLVNTRGIAQEVVSAFARKKLLYEENSYHNVVFAGYDEAGMMRHAHKRSTHSGKPFRQNVEGSDPRYSFHWIGTDGLLFVFEAPIDLLSFITLHPDDWEKHSYVACCGLSTQPLNWLLDEYPFAQVYLCLDNDKAGLSASQRMEKLVAQRGLLCKRLLPQRKDWNEDLNGV